MLHSSALSVLLLDPHLCALHASAQFMQMASSICNQRDVRLTHELAGSNQLFPRLQDCWHITAHYQADQRWSASFVRSASCRAQLATPYVTKGSSAFFFM